MYEDGVEIHIRSIFLQGLLCLILKTNKNLLNTKIFLKILKIGLALIKFQSYKPV